jgi:hypothetical protein
MILMTEWHEDEMREAGEALIEESYYNRTTSAEFLGELMVWASIKSDLSYEEWSKEAYFRLLEIARAYMRGA